MLFVRMTVCISDHKSIRGEKRVIKWALTFLCAIFCNISGISYAQLQEPSFHEISTEDGLSHSIVNVITQDKYGFMWFGTNAGLDRYDGYSFKNYVPAGTISAKGEGSNVTALLEDESGLFWVGTRTGLFTFDPEREIFNRIDLKTAEDGDITKSWVTAIEPCIEGGIWVGSRNGLFRVLDGARVPGWIDSSNADRYIYQSNGIKFIHYTAAVEDSAGLFHDQIYCLKEDRRGALWVGIDKGGHGVGALQRLPRSKSGGYPPIFKTYQQDENDKNNSIGRYPMTMHEDRFANIWVGTWGDGLYRVRTSDGSIRRFMHDPKLKKSINNNNVYAVIEDQSGNLWVCTWGGGLNVIPADELEADSPGFTHYTQMSNTPGSLSHTKLKSVFRDKSNIIWVGTYGSGINKARPRDEFQYFVYDSLDGTSISDNQVTSIIEDREGTIWAGTGGGVLNKFNSVEKSFTRFAIDAPGTEKTPIETICETDSGRLLIGHEKGIVQFDRKSEKFSAYPAIDTSGATEGMRVQKQGKKNRLLAIRSRQGTTRAEILDGDASLNSVIAGAFIRTAFEDSHSNLWLGTGWNGLYSVNSGHETLFTLKFNRSGRYNTFHFIEEDDAGHIWAGGAKGLIKINPETYEYTRFNISDGLANDNVCSVLQDDFGYLWISTHNGLSRMDISTNTFINFQEEVGMPIHEFIERSSLKARDGKIYLGSQNGMIVFNPERFKINERMPSVALTGLAVHNKRIGVGQKIEGSVVLEKTMSRSRSIHLTHHSNVLYFEFSVLDYHSPGGNKYAYKMEGIDKDWVHVGSNRRFASYAGIQPGTYTFTVKGANSSGIWNEEGTSISIRIDPPWYATLLFKIALASFGLMLFGLIFNIRTRSIRKRNRLLEEGVESRTKELKHRTAQSELIYEIGQNLLGELNLDILLDRTVEAVSTVFYSCTVKMLFYDVRLGWVATHHQDEKTDDAPAIKTSLYSDESNIGRVITEKRTIVNNNKPADTHFEQDESKSSRSQLSAPIRGGDRIIAILDIHSRDVNAFEESDIELMETLSSQISSAIENAHLYKQAQKEIAERKRAEEIATRAARAKNDFLANISHEIRTPMNAVIGMIDLALSSSDHKEQKECIEIVKNSADALLAILDDILDFSEIEAGRLDLKEVDFDPRNVVESTARSFASLASKKGTELICNIDSSLPATLKGDPGRLRQIITNIVGNSVKFTEDGEIIISVNVEKGQHDASRNDLIVLCFSVADTGIGIPEEMIETIFEVFTQVDSSSTRRYEGTGVGLTITKMLVEMMQGSIRVESTQGKGTTFYFTVQLELIASTGQQGIQKENQELPGKKCLIVDANSAVCMSLQKTLAEFGSDAEFVHDGEQALAQLIDREKQDSLFDVVLCDREIPGIDSFELARKIDSNPGLSTVKCIIMSSGWEPGDFEIYKKDFIAGHLLKPVLRNELLAAIKSPMKNIDRRRKRRAASEGKEGLQILLAEDNLVNQKVAVRTLEKMGHHVTVANNGSEAVDKLKDSEADLVLMDIQMPEMDGYEATRKIRNSMSRMLNANIPIIALTAHTMRGDREKCIAAGMNDYLSKPINKKELNRVLDTYGNSPHDEHTSSCLED